MNKLYLRSALRIFVITFFLMVIGQSLHAATLRWENDIEDWDTGVILGVDDLYVPQNDKTYDITFVDGYDPLPVYGIDSTFQGELYPGARAISGYQLFELRAYFDTLSESNIDSRLINGINDTADEFQWGAIHALYQYNWAGLEQMLVHTVTIYANSNDMAIGSGYYNPITYEKYYTHNTDNVWATFEESSTVPVPTSMFILWAGLTGLACINRRKK